jgi:hypothetical protein
MTAAHKLQSHSSGKFINAQRVGRCGAGGHAMSAMTPLRLRKSIYWIMRWGWRGPALLAIAVFFLWLYEMWKD